MYVCPPFSPPPPQTLIQDRRAVYRVLQEAGIAVPHHIVVNREGLEPGEDPPGFTQEVSFSGRH